MDLSVGENVRVVSRREIEIIFDDDLKFMLKELPLGRQRILADRAFKALENLGNVFTEIGQDTTDDNFIALAYDKMSPIIADLLKVVFKKHEDVIDKDFVMDYCTSSMLYEIAVLVVDMNRLEWLVTRIHKMFKPMFDNFESIFESGAEAVAGEPVGDVPGEAHRTPQKPAGGGGSKKKNSGKKNRGKKK